MELFNPTDTPLPARFFETKYGISRVTFWRYRKAGLPVIRVGRKCFIRESEFCAFLNQMDGKTIGVATPQPGQKGTDEHGN